MSEKDLIPDLTIGPDELFEGPKHWVEVDEIELVEMVVEVTSPSSLERDRHTKRLAYAEVNIPPYLLIDRTDQTVTLFSEPDGKDYRVGRKVPFGEKLPLPEPLGFDLDTSRLR